MNLLNPIVMTSAKEKVVSELRKAILSKRMVEGESLTLENIASQLNVSITPVREAFQILDRDGLIKLRKNKGAVVLGITDTYIKEHYQLRGILEASAVKLCTLYFPNPRDLISYRVHSFPYPLLMKKFLLVFLH